ncbi:hypothetical protein [Georgenia satyanarayanai]|uniref:hypothetical protein n=1 Tax=Georgenia satyanarayanai TaxID=860221 RepID=UPI001264AD98|nr:hypothetical protein [Georgenia satyanarayanai]
MTTTKFPALAGWSEYTDAVQAYSDLETQRRAHGPVLEALERGKADAMKADDAAQAEALRSGGKDPGRKHTVKWEKDLEAARNRARVLSQALEQQEQAVMALLRDTERAAQAVDQPVEDAAEAYEAAVDALLAARDTYFRATRARTWVLEGVPAGRRFKGAGSAPPTLTDPRVAAGTVSVWEELPEPTVAAKVLEAFRVEADSHRPKAPREETRRVLRKVPDFRGEATDSMTYRSIPVDAAGKPLNR